jgi:uncharacterized membrane protein YvlD (DUF360 family)
MTQLPPSVPPAPPPTPEPAPPSAEPRLRLRIEPLGVKLLAVAIAHHLSVIITNDDLTVSPLLSLLSLPFSMLLYGIPLAIYVLAVRTWAGTVAAGFGWIAVEVAVAHRIAESFEGSPAAGDLLVMPPYLVLTVTMVALGERLVAAGRGRAR